MRQQLKSLKNSGRLNVSKGSRKAIKKKKTDTPSKHLAKENHKKVKMTPKEDQDKDLILEAQKNVRISLRVSLTLIAHNR